MVDQTGAPFLIHGDTPWSLISGLTKEEAEQYLENRRQTGFNSIIVNLIEHKFRGKLDRTAIIKEMVAAVGVAQEELRRAGGAPGQHSIGVEGFNDRLEAGLIFGLHIELVDQRTIDVVSDGSWFVVPDGKRNWSERKTPSPDWHKTIVILHQESPLIAALR